MRLIYCRNWVNASFNLSAYAGSMSEAATKPSGGDDIAKAKLVVREAANPQQRDLILEFRQRVMFEELGFKPHLFDPAREIDEAERDAVARHIFLTAGKAVAGCLRSYTSDLIAPSTDMIEAFELEAFSAFDPKYVSFTEHLVIDKPWRSGNAAALMTAAAFKLARGMGAHFDFTISRPSLVGLYEKLGYRCYCDRQPDLGEGLRVPMVLVMDDVEHLKDINSPFAPLAMLQPPDQNVVEWFAENYPEAAGRKVKALRDEQNLWDYLTRQLHQNPLHGIPLFEGLTYDEARRFLKNATTLALRRGEELARAGDVGQEAYVLLSGEVEVHDQRGTIFANFGKGAILGEIGYLSENPRTADMMVTQDAEVLILTKDMFESIMETDPSITSKVLLNLTLILSERLTSTSAKLSARTQGL